MESSYAQMATNLFIEYVLFYAIFISKSYKINFVFDKFIRYDLSSCSSSFYCSVSPNNSSSFGSWSSSI